MGPRRDDGVRTPEAERGRMGSRLLGLTKGLGSGFKMGLGGGGLDSDLKLEEVGV